jgi:Undecaprenyl-phosphate glucose phosphotransferase
VTYQSQQRAEELQLRGFSVASRLFSSENVGPLTALVDFSLIVAASTLAGAAYHLVMLGASADPSTLLFIGANSGFLFVLLSASRGLYRVTMLLSPRKQLAGIVGGWTLILPLMTLLLFLLKAGTVYSRGATLVFGLLAPALLLSSRIAICEILDHCIVSGTLSGPRTVVIGSSDELAFLSPQDLLRLFGALELARFALPVRADGAQDAEIVNGALTMAQNVRADQILLALPWTDGQRRDLISEKLRCSPLTLLLVPDRSVRSMFRESGLAAECPICVVLRRAPLCRLELMLKRSLDLMLASAMLFILFPVLVLVSIAIRVESKGPIIFRQRRKGFNGSEFSIYKFRTMTVLEDSGAIRQARRKDERVTRVGAFLRQTSIDELPQLINVLRGEMSLVGPRPHAVAHDTEYSAQIANYASRHHVRPGITGWAQVNGLRGATGLVGLMEKRIQFDIWYVNNWSMRLDLWILLRTCFEVVRRRNAY